MVYVPLTVDTRILMKVCYQMVDLGQKSGPWIHLMPGLRGWGAETTKGDDDPKPGVGAFTRHPWRSAGMTNEVTRAR